MAAADENKGICDLCGKESDARFEVRCEQEQNCGQIIFLHLL